MVLVVAPASVAKARPADLPAQGEPVAIRELPGVVSAACVLHQDGYDTLPRAYVARGLPMGRPGELPDRGAVAGREGVSAYGGPVDN